MKDSTKKKLKVAGHVAFAVGMALPIGRAMGIGAKVGVAAARSTAGRAVAKKVATSAVGKKVGTRMAVEGQRAQRVINGWSSKKPGRIVNAAKKGLNWR